MSKWQRTILVVYVALVIVFGIVHVPWQMSTNIGVESRASKRYVATVSAPFWKPPAPYRETEPFAYVYCEGVNIGLLSSRIVVISLVMASALLLIHKRQ